MRETPCYLSPVSLDNLFLILADAVDQDVSYGDFVPLRMERLDRQAVFVELLLWITHPRLDEVIPNAFLLQCVLLLIGQSYEFISVQPPLVSYPVKLNRLSP